jgi:hypothetical protein
MPLTESPWNRVAVVRQLDIRRSPSAEVQLADRDARS